MKQKCSGFIAGVLATVTIGSLSITALAVSGKVSFNMSAIQFNGKQISAAGESYTLSNGTQAPSSITYTDEKGGGTTYLPARRISELLGVDIGYNQSSKSIVIGKDASAIDPKPSTSPNPTYKSVDMSTYESFRAILECTNDKYHYPTNDDLIRYWYEPISDYNSAECASCWKNLSNTIKEEYLTKLFHETFTGNEFTEQKTVLCVMVSFMDVGRNNFVCAEVGLYNDMDKLMFQY